MIVIFLVIFMGFYGDSRVLFMVILWDIIWDLSYV